MLGCTPPALDVAPAVACHVRRAGDDASRLLAVDVLRLSGAAIDGISTLHGEAIARPRLPATLG